MLLYLALRLSHYSFSYNELIAKGQSTGFVFFFKLFSFYKPIKMLGTFSQSLSI